jgi:hypothetical protein
MPKVGCWNIVLSPCRPVTGRLYVTVSHRVPQQMTDASDQFETEERQIERGSSGSDRAERLTTRVGRHGDA